MNDYRRIRKNYQVVLYWREQNPRKAAASIAFRGSFDGMFSAERRFGTRDRVWYENDRCRIAGADVPAGHTPSSVRQERDRLRVDQGIDPYNGDRSDHARRCAPLGRPYGRGKHVACVRLLLYWPCYPVTVIRKQTTTVKHKKRR